MRIGFTLRLYRSGENTNVFVGAFERVADHVYRIPVPHPSLGDVYQVYPADENATFYAVAPVYAFFRSSDSGQVKLLAHTETRDQYIYFSCPEGQEAEGGDIIVVVGAPTAAEAEALVK